MSDVREVLTRALSISANDSCLGIDWGRRFRVATSMTDHLYDPSGGRPHADYVNNILREYTEREIITILAAARLEGVWTPE